MPHRARRLCRGECWRAAAASGCPLIASLQFLGYAKELLGTSNDLGLGQPTPIRPLSEALGSSPLYYLINETTPSAASFDGRAVVDALRSTLSTEQQGQLIEYTSDAELGFACPQSFAGRSDCFAAFSVDAITLQDSRPAVNYTLRFNGAGLTVVRAPDNDGDYERTGLPLQNALDRAIMQVSLGLSDAQLADIPVPLEQPFSRQTNAEEDEDKRLQFLSGMRESAGWAVRARADPAAQHPFLCWRLAFSSSACRITCRRASRASAVAA
jgi:hypothetical protein